MRELNSTANGILMMIVSSLALTANAYAADAKKEADADKKMIASAMSAAPAKVSKDATIVAMEAHGKMRTLRKGTNGFILRIQPIDATHWLNRSAGVS